MRPPERSVEHAPDRAISPVIGVVALLAITVCLAGVLAMGVASMSPGSTPPTAAFELEADGDTGEITIEHVAGDAVDVRDLSVAIRVDGTALSSQPPVPFVGADGFDGAPGGAFNGEAAPQWRPGERVHLTVARTNDPVPESGDTVTVILSSDGRPVATLETTAS
ncbi:type IV pilin [Halopiger goleimassiliensis]|uniref:type IV pilin n=1 Tax=Halopiger goleimassiliensis TaxID=1293048 RepID=UPI0006778546|nr:type IV pilin N-terminal domain-containing protein [Halopiger goleimassiliensis]